MARLNTQEIVNDTIKAALVASSDGADTLAIVRGLEAVAHALVGVELAVREHGTQVSDIGPALERVVTELGGIAVSGLR